jgi:hypothetical protein
MHISIWNQSKSNTPPCDQGPIGQGEIALSIYVILMPLHLDPKILKKLQNFKKLFFCERYGNFFLS